MVFFTCDRCNESLKKNQVEKHSFKCRGCNSVTCIDCGVTFYGDDFKSHVVCISESEKYEKSLYKAKQKLSPQESWMKSIELAIDSSSEAPKSIQQYLTKLTDFGNIPRNKNKFSNFLKNSFRLQSTAIIDEIWDWISKRHAKETTIEIPEPSNDVIATESLKDTSVTNCNDESDEKVKDKKKNKKHRRDADDLGTM
jgi:cell growth-regulating nucleolar protein